MSSLFSYELNEEKIRLTLQDSGAVEYNETSWDDFEANFDQNIATQNQSKFKLPEFNLNINRNLVLPAVFIAGLVGISAIMLSFIDFKTNTPKQVEKGMVPNPDSYKPEETKAAVIIKKEAEKPVEKPMVKPGPVLEENVIEDQPLSSQNQVALSTPSVNPTTPSVTVTDEPVSRVQTARTTNGITDSTSSLKNDNPVISNNTDQTFKSKKRRRKMPTEQIETIKAPSILGAQSTVKEEEPEMEIKLN